MPNQRQNRRPRAKRPKVPIPLHLQATRALASLSLKRRPRRRNLRSNLLSRRPNRVPRMSAPCVMSNTERVSTILIPTTVTPGTLLYVLPVNPTSAPRASATASQFDSWFGNVSLEVETTGNAFSKDYVVVKHVPNGDPARLPSNVLNTLNFAESSDRAGDSRKLQLDSNQRVVVTAPWSESYNPKKPILDDDPSDCNNGLFIIVANGSPGTDPVSLTVRLKYNFHFFGPIFVPILTDNSNDLVGNGSLATNSIFGATPIITGLGELSAAINTVTVPFPGRYLVAASFVGTVLTGSPTVVASSGSTITSYVSSFTLLESTLYFVFTSTIPSATFTFSSLFANTIVSSNLRIASYSA